MGRLKPRHPKRETHTQRIEKKLAIKVMVEMALQDKRNAFLDAFGGMMTEAERAEYLRTGHFDGGDSDGVVPEPVAK